MPKSPNDVFRQTRLDESAEYIAKREELRLAELESMRLRERVARLRRQLPTGALVADYLFLEGPADLHAGDTPVKTVPLSGLFTGPERVVVLYQFVFGKRQTTPDPMCTMLVDGFNGAGDHLAQSLDFAVVAAAGPTTLRAHARSRGWNRLRLLSTIEASTFQYDCGGDDGKGNQEPTMSVFTREKDGSLRHFYSAHPLLGPGIPERGFDLLSPLYNILDLTGLGRDCWPASAAQKQGFASAHR